MYLNGFRGHTALHKAVQQKHRNICYMLVAAGASLTMRDANGLTPMMIAFQVEDNDLATYLESMFQSSIIIKKTVCSSIVCSTHVIFHIFNSFSIRSLKKY